MNAAHDSKPVVAVRQATMSDVGLLGEIYAEAFADDPMFAWISPRSKRTPGVLFGTLAQACCLQFNEVHLTADGSGAAMWLPPGASLALSWWAQFTLGWRLRMACGVAGLRRVFALEECLRKHHRHDAHWYLLAIGVRPSRAGQGVGAALLRETLPKCDRDGLPVCLETCTAKNLPLYEHFGFTLTGEDRLPWGGPPVWFMTRQPGAAH